MIKKSNIRIDHEQPEILIYGIGNPGRQDDALGILLIEKVETWIKENNYSCITTDQNYQLNIEDAESISRFDLVIFLDASIHEVDSVLIEPVKPDLKQDFSMHQVTPSFILELCDQLFSRYPETYQLHIRGYDFEFMKSLSFGAKENLRSAFDLLISFLQKYLASKKH